MRTTKNIAMLRILIVEPSKSLAKLLETAVSGDSNNEIVIASHHEDADAVLSKNAPFDLLITSVSAFDIPPAKIIKKIESWALPTFLYTSINDEIVETHLTRSTTVLDYIIKDAPDSLEYLVSLVRRFESNAGIQALVVDDSKSQREYLTTLLENYNFTVYSSPNGRRAIEFYEQHPTIKVVITDYNMPGMDGPEMVRTLRTKEGGKRLIILGMTSTEKSSLAVKFIKNGADDYVKKPFHKEEFFSRLNKSLELSEKSAELNRQALFDYLTGIPNRRAFFSAAPDKLSYFKKQKMLFSVVQIDLDHFKKINDDLGHEAGDAVLKSVASKASSLIQKGEVFARLGGEEFGAIITATNSDQLICRLEELRNAIESLEIDHGDNKFKVTASIGAMYVSEISSLASIDEYLDVADKALYISKENGRNRVTVF